jgi:hypothetical protein
VFGFFTVGSQYTTTGLVALDRVLPDTANVAVITNMNGFSKSVAEGAKATIAAAAGLSLQSETNISVYMTPLTTEDKTKIKTAMDMGPDIVVIAGHNKDVEPVILEISAMSSFPKAILATNGLTALSNYGSDQSKANCVMMPTQWDSSASAKDSVVGWDSAAFKAAGGTTYQHAAMGAVGVAIANAMEKATGGTMTQKTANLAQALRTLDIDSFYGKLKWDTHGRIQKPMYTEQKLSAGLTIVAPQNTSSLQQPLTNAVCWGAAPGTTTVAAGTTTVAAGNTSNSIGNTTALTESNVNCAAADSSMFSLLLVLVSTAFLC